MPESCGDNGCIDSKSRVTAFPDVFGMMNRGPEGTKSRCKPGMWLWLEPGQLSYDWCIFVK